MQGFSYYQLYEMQHAALGPFRAVADMTQLYLRNPLNPLSQTPLGRSLSAGLELFERSTRRYAKPSFGLTETVVGGTRVPVHEAVVWERPFCRLIHFERTMPPRSWSDPKLLIVAPMSGHYATLLRGTIATMLPRHDVYVTDWIDARMVPPTAGSFDLDDYIDTIMSILHVLGGDVHVMAVCQPAVPVLAATALMEAHDDPYAPASVILMGGPIDTRINPTAVNVLAAERGTDWFRDNVIMKVPFPHPGFMRDVYPGFLQLSGFMGMNLDRHVTAHYDFFRHLVKDDGDEAEKHREFYDEYLAVMDLTAEFYLQTVDTVFVRHALPKGEMTYRGEPVDLRAIRNAALLSIEGENDDISGIGQTRASLDLTPNIPMARKAHYMQPRVGHYGVFNGSRFRAEIAPRIGDFIRSNLVKPSAAPARNSHAAKAAPAPAEKPAIRRTSSRRAAKPRGKGSRAH